MLVAQGVVLGAGQTYSASASVQVPAAVEGNYRWQVHVNSAGDIFEGVNWTNNLVSASALTSLSVPALAVGGEFQANSATASGQYTVFKVTLPVGGQVVISLQGGDPNSFLDLYAASGYVPTTLQFDLESSQVQSPLRL